MDLDYMKMLLVLKGFMGRVACEAATMLSLVDSQKFITSAPYPPPPPPPQTVKEQNKTYSAHGHWPIEYGISMFINIWGHTPQTS